MLTLVIIVIVFWCSSNSSNIKKRPTSAIWDGFPSAELRKELSSGFHFTPKSSTRPRTVAWRKKPCQVPGAARLPSFQTCYNYLWIFKTTTSHQTPEICDLTDLTDSLLRAQYQHSCHSCHLVFSDQNPAPNYHQLICSKLGIHIQINQHHFFWKRFI